LDRIILESWPMRHSHLKVVLGHRI